MTLLFRQLFCAPRSHVLLQTTGIGYLRRQMFRACTTTDNTASSASSRTTREATHGTQKHPTTSADAVSSTHRWFHNVVLGQKLCPFAAPLASDTHKLRIVASSAATPHQAVADVTREALFLMRDESSHHETTLLVFGHDGFVKEFREFIHLSWALQEKAVLETGLEGALQLVLFHPQATHQTYGGCDEDDPADYTIRSPFPTVHLLREQDVVRAVTGGYPNLEELPNRNKARLVAQGLETCQQRLVACYIAVK